MTSNGQALEELVAVMDRLLAKDGCPWDREQTHKSLVRYLLEETYEVIEAINEGNMNKLKEELGDLLLQVVFHAALAEREGRFTFADVAETVRRKMIFRHPHVFGEMNLQTADDVMENWEKFKAQEGKKYLLEGIPAIMPALMRAVKMQEKAAQVGFDWPNVDGAIDKLKEEIDEVKEAVNREQLQEEIGDMLFAMVNIARMFNIEPEEALQGSNEKFARRFNYIEEQVKSSGKEFSEYSLAELDMIWDRAKDQGL